MRLKSISVLSKLSLQLNALSFICLLLLLSNNTLSQNHHPKITIYKTYEDFHEKKGEVIGNLTSYKSNYWDKYSLKTDKGNFFSLKGIWGFTLDSSLFRVIGIGTPIYVHTQGKFVYYEHGKYYINQLLDGKANVDYNATFRYFSDGLSSDFVESSAKAFALQNTEFKPAYLCYKEQPKSKDFQEDINNFRACVDAYIRM